MRFILRDKLFGIGGDLTIQDDRGRQVYFVDGKLISIGRRLEFRDSAGDVAAVIQKRLIALCSTYEIDLPGRRGATISKALFSPFVDRLKIDVPGPGDLDVHGDLFHHEYAIDRRGREVARVSKAWVSLVNSYGVEIDEGEDALLILCGAVVIDAILDEDRDNRN